MIWPEVCYSICQTWPAGNERSLPPSSLSRPPTIVITPRLYNSLLTIARQNPLSWEMCQLKKVKILFTKNAKQLKIAKTDFYNFEGKEHWQRGKWEENCLQKSHSNTLTGQMCGGIQVKFITFFPFLVTECSSTEWGEVEGYSRTESTSQHSWLPKPKIALSRERNEISLASLSSVQCSGWINWQGRSTRLSFLLAVTSWGKYFRMLRSNAH